ncbi:hypothetical protein KR018_010265 [Drosophila ironensis]|nr:hypothetical protein KR018_010265 [Drosophila ironensis]
MERPLLEIINALLCSDTEKIRLGTNALNKAHQNPLTLISLCNIVVSPMEIPIRQFAAVLINRRLNRLRHWQMVSPENQETIKKVLLQALVNEKEKQVKTAIAQVIGSLVRHEADKKDAWLNDLLAYIFARCSSSDPKESETGSSTFATLADAAPDQFAANIDYICTMFVNALMAAEANNDLATATVCNMLRGINCLLPFVCGNHTAEQTIGKVTHLVLKSMHAQAQKGMVQEFLTSFDYIDCLMEYTPKLVTNVRPLVEFCLELAGSSQIEDPIRIQAISMVGRFSKCKKKTITKQKLVEPILNTIFEMLCRPPRGDEEDEEYISCEEGSTTMNAASQTLDVLALQLSPEKVIPPLLQILEPALQNPDPVRRRSAYICMSVIVEGCSEAIRNKYMEVMLNIIKAGIHDQELIVRNASFFCLGQFSEHLQPELSKFSPKIMPVFFEYLGKLVADLQMGLPEPKYLQRMFYALETFVENLEEKVVSYLPILMERLFELLSINISAKCRELVLSCISSSAASAKQGYVPYFSRTITFLQGFMQVEVPENLEVVRTQAIDTLASLARSVGRETFLPLANDTMTYCLRLLNDGPDDPDLRRCVYNLMGALSIVAKEDMASVFPSIFDRMIESVISTQDMLPVLQVAEEVDPAIEINLEEESDESDTEMDGFQVENDYLVEKEEAILTLKEFAAESGSAFAPYLQSSFENVYKMLDHPQDTIRRACIEALAEFVKALHKMGDTENVLRTSAIIVPKLTAMARDDDDQGVVISVLDALGTLFEEVKEPVLCGIDNAELVYHVIKDLFANKMSCQFNEHSSIASGGGDEEDLEDSEFDEAVFENTGNLLPLMGYALPRKTFTLYFGRLYPIFIQKMTKKASSCELRGFLFGALADCFQHLGHDAAAFFDDLCPVFIRSVQDRLPRTRQNVYYGLGELVYYSDEKSFPMYPEILHALSEAIARERDAAALDNICGAVARLIITNVAAMPLEQVLPVWMTHLPLRDDMDECDTIQKAFQVLYMSARNIIEPYLEQMLAVSIHMLYKDHLSRSECTRNCVTFIKDIKINFPDRFQKVSSSSEEVFQFLQTL